MKANTILRIVFYSILILVLTGILLSSLGISALVSLFTDHTDTPNTSGHTVLAEGINGLELNWTAGSITIITADTDVITFSESGNFSDKQAMVYELMNNTLFIDFAPVRPFLGAFFQSQKDLVITVPQDWTCQELRINGAGLKIKANDLVAQNVELNGAGIQFNYTGTMNTFSCDGAGCELEMNLVNAPHEMDIDGAGCSAALQLPTDCGFLVQTDGLGCNFRSNVAHSTGDEGYFFGNQNCSIDVDGLGCAISITLADVFY